LDLTFYPFEVILFSSSRKGGPFQEFFLGFQDSIVFVDIFREQTVVRELPVVVLVSFITMFIVEAIKVSVDFVINKRCGALDD
jgi:hypothetical protein